MGICRQVLLMAYYVPGQCFFKTHGLGTEVLITGDKDLSDISEEVSK